jgi:hypothetical protein
VTRLSAATAPNSGSAAYINSLLGPIVSFVLSAFASVAVTTNAYAEVSHPLRFSLLLLLLIAWHLLMNQKLWLFRELKIYAALIGYMCLSLLWTQNVSVALDTLTATINCALLLALFGALISYHSRPAVFAGMLVGFVAAAVMYTLTQRFPFAYPEGFSYNAIAGMYLFGLLATILFGWFTRRTVIPVGLVLVLLTLIAATTSIKTNLGIALGTICACLFYLPHIIKAIRKTLFLLIALGALAFIGVNSNDALIERVNAGVDRLSMGINVLLAREDVSGQTAFESRKDWKDEGLNGWMHNPVVGSGVEGFRIDYGVTSHSTPVDLLYNSGVIGFGLFYAVLISILWRLYSSEDSATAGLRAVLFGALVCYLFMSLSSTLYYDSFLLVFVSISAALLAPSLKKPRTRDAAEAAGKPDER